MDETAVWSWRGCVWLSLAFSVSGPASAGAEAVGAWYVDGSLQDGLIVIDESLGTALGIEAAQRCCGVLDLASGAVAMVRGDAMMYGAGLPQLGILLGVFATRTDAGRPLPRDEFRELALMIKANDDVQAAKYARRVGLPMLAQLYQSPRYRLYAPEFGGGLWSGRYYGSDQPRVGDPIANLSHAATVRAVLRFYWLLEQGELVSRAASQRMLEVFVAPAIDPCADAFVRGLKDRQVGVLQKGGHDEDWHLDSARVQHGARRYALVGLVHHARGDEYLASLAERVDDLLVGGAAPKRPVSRMFTCRGDWWGAIAPSDLPAVRLGQPPVCLSGAAAPETWTSPILPADRLFNEVLLSWNLQCGLGAAYAIEVRVGRSYDESWSPWLRVGSHGGAAGQAVTSFAGGKADIDIVRASERYDLVQARVLAGGGPIAVHRLVATLTDATGLPVAVADPAPAPFVLAAAHVRRLAVPFRSQQAEAAALRSRICSPTSVAMVLEYHGVERLTAAVAELLYDPQHDIYGNWPRAVQGAFEWGLPGYLARFSDWNEVAAVIEQGEPLIISIAVRPGQLTGAPYPKTAGHLLVVTGFDAAGDVHVNDPAAIDSAQGITTYARAELEEVWLRRGGTAYVLMRAEQPAATGRPARRP